MASINEVLSIVATTSQRIRQLEIKSGQLIFLQDIGRIAFDFKGKRVFYNQIVELEKDEDRLALENPLDGYYFVIDKAILWFYKNGWTQITSAPQEVIFIGVELPTLGQANKIYINKKDGYVSVWDEDVNQYIIVADCTNEATNEDIEKLFIN